MVTIEGRTLELHSTCGEMFRRSQSLGLLGITLLIIVFHVKTMLSTRLQACWIVLMPITTANREPIIHGLITMRVTATYD
jgi:hypothetical protein